MPKTIEAKDVTHKNLNFVTDDAGSILNIHAFSSVGYDGGVRVNYTDDIWPLLTQGQQNAMQAFHDKLMQFLHDKYLA